MTPRMLLIVIGAAGGLLFALLAILCFLPKKRKKSADDDDMAFGDDDFGEDTGKAGKKKKKKKGGKKGSGLDEDEDPFGNSDGFSTQPPNPFEPVGEAPSNPFGDQPSFAPITVPPEQIQPSSHCVVDATEFLRRLFEAFEQMNLQSLGDAETEDLLSSHNTILTDYRNSGAQRVTKLVVKKEQRDVGQQSSNGWDYLTTEVDCTIQDYIKDMNTGEIAGGSMKDTYDVTYMLTFARPSGTPAYALYRASLM